MRSGFHCSRIPAVISRASSADHRSGLGSRVDRLSLPLDFINTLHSSPGLHCALFSNHQWHLKGALIFFYWCVRRRMGVWVPVNTIIVLPGTKWTPVTSNKWQQIVIFSNLQYRSNGWRGKSIPHLLNLTIHAVTFHWSRRVIMPSDPE